MDLYRLKLAVGLIKDTKDYMEMAQIAIQDGNTGEALKIIDAGFKSGALGTGNEAARHGHDSATSPIRSTLMRRPAANAENEAEKSG